MTILCVALSVILLGVLAWGGYESYRADLAEERVKTLVADNTLLSERLKDAESIVEDQTKKVGELKDQADAASQAAQEALTAAQLSANVWRVKYDRLLRAPRNVGDACVETQEMVEGYFALRKEEASNGSAP